MEVVQPKSHTSDERFMYEALLLAEHKLCSPHPNPRVGCVIVKDDEIVGRGFHEQAGHAHAEVMALKDAGALANNGTCYVTLEPCGHHGQTPPCLDALLDANISRVVVASEDPNPLTRGKSIRKLREKGIIVDTDCLTTKSQAMNRGFYKRMQQGKPYVRVKMAMSLDGKTADGHGQSKWITSSAAREDVHRYRAKSDVVLSTAKTVLDDNARLTARVANDEVRQQPLRVILDRELSLETGSFFDEPSEVLLCHDQATKVRRKHQADYLALPTNQHGLDLAALCKHLGKRDYNEVWVEAGPTLFGSLVEQGLVDEVVLYIAPKLLGQHGQALVNFSKNYNLDDSFGFTVVSHEQIGPDIKLVLRKEEL